MDADGSVRICGRYFTAAELERIRQLAAQLPTRAAVARAVCEDLGWRQINGEPKLMSCRVALLRLHRAGSIALPESTRQWSNRAQRPHLTEASEYQIPICGSRGDLAEVELVQVRSRAQARLWRELVERYHYLGYQPLPGAQVRYLVQNRGLLLAVLGFGAAAWKVAPRDEFIGWNPQQRQARLHLVVNNHRFLVLPWVQVRFLASSVLAQAARQLPADFQARYGYRPLLLESFVETQRYAGTSYAAANWICVGSTQGRGKLDRYHHADKPIKTLWLYPLDQHFRAVLCAP
jgi:hypothetical protein